MSGISALVMALAAALLFGAPEKAEALPAFAKKYNAPCTLCHTVWPRLNEAGAKFRMNAYQMLDSRDGGETGKTSPSFDLHLDTGKANPPLSFRVNGGLQVFGPSSGPEGALPNNFPCCMNGNTASITAAGTLDSDLGFLVSYQLGKTEIDQGFLRVANIWGPGYFGVDLGGFRTSDADAVSPNREWFGTANPAFFGTANTEGRDVGLALGYADTGMRFFGNPDYGPFSYDIVIASGSRHVGQGINTRGNAFSFMARLDTGGFSGSFRYWNSKSGELLFTQDASGLYSYDFGQTATAATQFAPDRMNADEKTQDYLFAVNYRGDRWELEAVYDMNNFSLGQRTNGANTYARSEMKRAGYSLGYIYRLSPFMNFGARWGVSSVKGYDETYNGATTSVPPANASQIELKWELLPVQNARLSVHWLIDLSNARARTDGSGAVYNQQNKLFLLWDWAI